MKKIQVRLCDEATVIEGTLSKLDDTWIIYKRPWLEALSWRCPCGADIDTATMTAGMVYRVDGGYFLRCQGCSRLYMHHTAQGYVEEVPSEKCISDELLTRMPDEANFIREILSRPEDTELWALYADHLGQRGDARGAILRTKCELASIPTDDPRRDDSRASLDLLRPRVDPNWFALVIRLGPAALCLIGCPATDLAALPPRLQFAGIHVRPIGTVEDEDYVVFCISCCDGPTLGTREAVIRCAGRTVAPVAIVLTRAENIKDESLRSLVTVEEMQLLSQVLPCEVVERLPIYYDFDPGLARKLLARISEGPGMITCCGG